MEKLLKDNAVSIVLCVLAIAVMLWQRMPSKADTSSELSREVRAALATAGSEKGKIAALRLSAQCLGLAAIINLKDDQGAPPYRTGKALDNARKLARDAVTGGTPLTQEIPALDPVLTKFFKNRLGEDAGAKSDKDIRAWYDALIEMSKASAEAYGGL